MVHNPDARYFNDYLPVAEASTLFLREHWTCPPNVAVTPNNIDDMVDMATFNDRRAAAKKWLQSKRGIPCDRKMSWFCAEYNLFNYYGKGLPNEEIKDLFFQQLAQNHADDFSV